MSAMYAIIALLLVAAFWLLDGYVRARIQRHRTGDSGIRIPRTPKQWWARGTLASWLCQPDLGPR